VFIDERGNYEVEKTYDNHYPKISGEISDGNFRGEIDYQPNEKNVYYNREKAQGDENEGTEH